MPLGSSISFFNNMIVDESKPLVPVGNLFDPPCLLNNSKYYKNETSTVSLHYALIVITEQDSVNNVRYAR